MLLHRMRLGFGVMVLSSLSISAYATTSTNTALPAGLSMNPQAAHALDKSSSTVSTNEKRLEWRRLIELGVIDLPAAPASELKADSLEHLPASQDKAAPLPKMGLGNAGPQTSETNAVNKSSKPMMLESNPSSDLSTKLYTPLAYNSTYYVAPDAYQTYPNRTVGKLFMYQGDTPVWMCSGAAIGPNHILTAGHCVYDPDNKRWVDSIEFYPAFYFGADQDYGVFSVDTQHIWASSAFVDYQDACRDVAFLKANLNAEGHSLYQEVGYLGWLSDTSRYQNWHVMGYASASPWNGRQLVQTDADTANADVRYKCVNDSPNQISINSALTGGSSGGPWLLNDSQVGGVVSLGGDGTVTSPYFDENIHNLLVWLRNQ